METQHALNQRQRGIIPIAAFTADGDIQRLKPAFNEGLDAGLTVNEIKEILVHLYAYTGFPRSLNANTAFMEVMDERKAKGIVDAVGKEASPVPADLDRDEYGGKVRAKLAGQEKDISGADWQLFSPAMDTFLKEHLFADLFVRDVISHEDRELATISALANMTGTEGQLFFHLGASMNTGLTEAQMKDFISVLDAKVAPEKAASAEKILNAVLKKPGNPVMKISVKTTETNLEDSVIFDRGEINPYGKYFSGTSYLNMLSLEGVITANVTFEPGCINNWHTHQAEKNGGQILLVTGGHGWYQEEGKEARELHAGDVVYIPAGVKHWHGAAKDSWFVHIAVEVPGENASTQWHEPVDINDYNKLK